MLYTVRTSMDWRKQPRAGACEIAAIVLAVGAVLLSAAPARACTTPVYRYAMYNWEPFPYVVFYVHYGEPDDEHAGVRQMITELAETGPAVANVVFEEVDLSLEDFDQLPGPLKDAWLSYVRTEARTAEPVHLLFTSWGAKLHAGRLDEAMVRAMVDSPVRTRIGELLEGGCATVMVFLPGSDAAENERAEKVAREVIEQAASGAIPIDSGFVDPSQWLPPGQVAGDAPSGEAPADGASPPNPNAIKVGLIEVARPDEAEKWLIRSLTAIESDLGELAEQPMIFFAYGRGRAMLPYVGKGVNPENLAREIQFLASACSCFVKEQNPGKDLLMRWDWNATAEAMAADDPAFAAGPFAYQEFSPDATGDMVPSTEPEATAEVASAVAGSQPEAEVASPPEADPGEAAAEPPQAADAGSAAKEQPEKTSEALALQEPDADVAALAADSPPKSQGGSFAGRQMGILGIGLAAVTAIILLAGFVLILMRTGPGERPVP